MTNRMGRKEVLERVQRALEAVRPADIRLVARRVSPAWEVAE